MLHYIFLSLSHRISFFSIQPASYFIFLFLGVSTHLSLRPHPNLSWNCCLWELCLSISSFIFHVSPSITHPAVTCPQGPVNDDSSLKHIFPLISSSPPHPSIHPPVPLQLLPLPSPSFISPQSPAVLVSVSELSPPRTWRPRSPAPRKGSELQHRKEELGRDAASYRTPQTATHFLSCSFMRLLSSDQARTWTHKLCLNPPKAGYTHTHTHVHTLPCSSISESIFAR